ncbi:MAG: dihydrolipoamide acetyltransferase family protein, partial [Burkholderiales bacterium]
MFEFTMPSLGAGMEEGTFVEWLVQPGQEVKRGDIACVVETQKGAVEVEIWEAGTVAKLVAQPGEIIPVGQTMAVLATEGESAEEVARTWSAQAKPPSLAPAVAAQPAEEINPPRTEDQRIRVSPAARKRAEELGIDLSLVVPQTPGGAVTLEDVERYAKPVAQDRQAAMREGMREVIGAAMARSKREIPHYYVGSEINVENANQWLERYNASRSVSERMLFAAIELKAVALALRETLDLNGWYTEKRFRRSQAIHTGVAISLRGGGLIAPALHDTDKLSLPDVMASLADLLKRARSGQLRSSEYTDATITVSNLGELGAQTLYGVIYPPQVALV